MPATFRDLGPRHAVPQVGQTVLACRSDPGAIRAEDQDIDFAGVAPTYGGTLTRSQVVEGKASPRPCS